MENFCKEDKLKYYSISLVSILLIESIDRIEGNRRLFSTGGGCPHRNRWKRITRHDAPHNIWPQSRHEGYYVSARRHRHTDGYVSRTSNESP